MPTHPCSISDAINTCAGELPEGWRVRLDIELHGFGMSIIDPDGNEHDFDAGGEGLADDFLYALELAKQKHNKEKS